MRIPSVISVQFGFCRAAFVLVSLLLLTLTRPASAEDLPEPVTSELDYFNETIINAEPVNGDALSLDPEPYVNAEPWWHLPERRVPWYFARFRGGNSYYSVPNDTKFGGEYGVNVVVPAVRGFAGIADIGFNHISTGTQVLGTLGVAKVARTDAPPLMKGLVGMVLFDQYTDTRIDDLYISSIRVVVSKRLNPETSIGAVYVEPLEGDRANFALIPGATPISVSLAQTRSVRGLLSRRLDEATQVNGWVGYRDVANTVGYGGGIRRAFSDRVAAIAQATYEDKGLWSGFAGIEVAFGRVSNSCCHRGTLTVDNCDISADQEVVRGGAKNRYYYYGEDRRIYETFVKEKKAHKGGLYSYAEIVTHIFLFGSIADYNRSISNMEEAMMMMQMMENGGINFGADCDTLVGQLLAAFQGDTNAAINALIENMRTDCLGDPRLFGGG